MRCSPMLSRTGFQDTLALLSSKQRCLDIIGLPQSPRALQFEVLYILLKLLPATWISALLGRQQSLHHISYPHQPGLYEHFASCMKAVICCTFMTCTLCRPSRAKRDSVRSSNFSLGDCSVAAVLAVEAWELTSTSMPENVSLYKLSIFP